jgi:L-threonylcarbamoyladenylate synthase
MAAEIVSIEQDGAEAARAALERCVGAGGVALFPADGLYGLACDPIDAAAVDRIHEIKDRDEGKPSAVMYFDQLAMREVLGQLGPRARAAVAALLPGPVTLVLPNPERRYPLACRGTPEQLGVRLIGGPLAGMPRPIFQTSANRSGQPAPASFDAVDRGIVDAVDLAIDGGALPGIASTVVDLTRVDDGDAWAVLRQGALDAAEVERRLAASTATGPVDAG